jgi:CBS domain containing-hemolysin-like protein
MIELAIITVLILLNGIFVAAEFAIVGAPKAAIDARAAQGDRLARLVQRVLRDTQLQDRYIATAQLGITLASLGLGMYGEHVLADAIYYALDSSGVPALIVSHGVASVTAVAILTYFHIVVGEMVPKSLALQQAERLACWITPPMLWTKNILYPFVVTLNGLGNKLLKLIGVNRQAQNAEQ